MRLHHRYKEASGYVHTLKAIMCNPEEDGKDSLQCIEEMLQITKQAMGLDVPIIEKKLERKNSKPHENIIGIRSQNQGSSAQGKQFLMSKISSLNQKVKQTKSNGQPAPPGTVRPLFPFRRLACLTSCEQRFPASAKRFLEIFSQGQFPRRCGGPRGPNSQGKEKPHGQVYAL